MRKIIVVISIAMLVFSIIGCGGEDVDYSDETTQISEDILEKYKIGDEVELGGEKFNIYKIDDKNNELYLLAQSNIVTTAFSASDREQKYLHKYEGSLIEGLVNRFADNLEDIGIVVEASGIIEKDDLIELGFNLDGLNGTQYKLVDAPEFLSNEENFWVNGYCKYDTYAWAYYNGILTTYKCEDEYGVRPVIIVAASELDKPLQEDTNLTIKEIIASDCAWSSEGGIENPYDRFFFDCEKMVFINIFESSEMSDTCEFGMEFIDEKTIRIDGVMRRYEYPAEITIVNENKLRIRFIDDAHNDGDYYLNKVTK